MTQTSYPIVNVNHSASQWRTAQDIGDGIVDDLTGTAYGLTVTGSDTLTISPGRLRVDGIVHDITAAETVTLAAVSTPTTYLIGVKVDFSQEQSAAQMILVAEVKGSTTARIIPLWEVDRSASTVLSASPVRDLRAWASEQVWAGTLAAAPADAPCGAVLRTSEGTLVRRPVSGVMAWATLDATPPTGLTYGVGWEAYSPNPAKAARTADGRIVLSGLAIRTANAPGITLYASNTFLVATLPQGVRPSTTRFLLAHSAQGTVGVLVYPDGRVLLRSASPGTSATLPIPAGSIERTWVSFDGLILEA